MKTLPRILQVLFILVAIALAVWPAPPELIENLYSNGLYPMINGTIAPLSNSVPFAVSDVLLVGLIVGLILMWLIRLVRTERGLRLRALGLLALDTITVAAFVVFIFSVSWGLNYSRNALTDKLDYDEKRITLVGERELLDNTVRELNQMAPLARNTPGLGSSAFRSLLDMSFDKTMKDLGTASPTFAVAPKPSLLDGYLEAASVSGYTDPWTHEVVLVDSLLPVERPFTLAHEWAHLAGYASESEANFIGFLTCIRSQDPMINYSGWLELYLYLPKPRDGGPAVSPLVAADVEAIRQRVAAHENKQVSQANRDMYDRYLKANRVEEGIGNYGLFIRLVLGTRFTGDWAPVRREAGGPPSLSPAQ